MQDLTANAKPLSAITPAEGASGTSAITGSTIDSDNFRSVLFLVHLGPIAAGAVTSFKLQHGDASDLSDAADIAGSSQSIADDGDNLVRYADLHRVTKRYCRIVVSRGTAAATIGSAIALLYGAVTAPFTQTAVGELIAPPASGTA